MICRVCSNNLEEGMFSWRNKSKGIRHTICKSCKREVDNSHYKKSDKRRKSIRDSRVKNKDSNIEWYENYKSNCSCMICGETKTYMLDFHHINKDEKEDIIPKMVYGGCSKEKILKEINKCVVLCANHHREYHYLEKIKGFTTQEYLNMER